MPPKNANGAGTSNTTNATQTQIERDIDAMLQKSQPKNFNGEGRDVGKVLEDWIEHME